MVNLLRRNGGGLILAEKDKKLSYISMFVMDVGFRSRDGK